LVTWGIAVVVLGVLGRRSWARALAGFIPDCIVLFRRLLADGRVPRSCKLALWLLLGYLALPFDVVPDFIPVAGQLDDAVLLALALRHLIRRAGTRVVAQHWPGPAETLNAVLLLSGARVR
jgi:uncharacterized membrane protein YkvA (DUF1232 family)